MTPSEYFSDYNDEKDDIDYDAEKEISPDKLKRIWLIHRYIFEYIIKGCPFPLSRDQYEWILNSLDDI